MSNIKKQVLLAKLNACNNDLSKQWFVYFSIRNPETHKLERVKLYEGFAKLSTVAERTRHGEKLIQETNEKLNSGWNPLAGRTISLSDAVILPIISEALTEALKEHKNNLRSKSFSSYQSHIRGFCNWLTVEGLEDLPINDFTSRQANQFISYLMENEKVANATRNAYLRTLKTFFSRYFDNHSAELNLKNPFGKIKKIRSNSKGAKPFEPYQIIKLKEAISKRDPQLWFFIQFMFYCYVRPTEIRCLKVGDIHGDKILIRGEISKNKKTEYVAIPRPFMQAIKEQGILNYPESLYIFGRNNQPGPKNFSVNHFSFKHLEILRELNFSSQHKFYSWKHTGVITAYNSGAKLKDLQMQLRHHSLDMVNIYLQNLGIMDSDFFKNRFPEI